MDADGNLRQWIGTGLSVWPMDGMPRMTTDQIPMVFGWDAKKCEKLYIEELGELPYSGADAEPEDVLLKRVGPVMIIGGDAITAWEGEGRIVFLRLEDAEPAEENCEAYLRENVIVIKKGLLLEGIIEPYHLAEETKTEIVRIMTE